eukprot:jgi/Psemu1/62096/gm1.62096_g
MRLCITAGVYTTLKRFGQLFDNLPSISNSGHQGTADSFQQYRQTLRFKTNKQTNGLRPIRLYITLPPPHSINNDTGLLSRLDNSTDINDSTNNTSVSHHTGVTANN